MTDYVQLGFHRNRGWPWPEKSWGLSPMYGDDGWCRACGVPSHEQTGSLVLQRRGLTVSAGWVPFWQYDAYCLVNDIADEARDRFGLGFRPVLDPRGKHLGASQVVLQSDVVSWFSPEMIAPRITAVHGESGEACAGCGVWRWMPVSMDVLPPPPQSVLHEGRPVIVSPEWFGAGWQARRQILWRSDVADFLVAAAPRDFRLVEMSER